MHISFVCLLTLVLVGLVVCGRDFYKILGLKKNAKEAEIKRAYRKMSLKYHPDKNSAADASDKFAEIATAYDILSNSEKRQTYDRGGEDAVTQQEQRSNQPAADPFNIFSHFGFGGGGQQQRNEDPRTPNVEIPLRVTLAQLYSGDLIEVEYSRQVLCVEARSCEKNMKDCQGPGVKLRVQQLAPGFVQQVQVADASCVARGKAWKSPCKACPNGMTESEDISLTLDLQSGMREGEQIKFDQVADEAVGHIAGDLVFNIKQVPHEFFVRQGDDLTMSMTISLLDSLVGFSRTFDHVDGHKVVVKKADVTYCSEVMRVMGEGMPRKGSRQTAKEKQQRGDLLVTLLIHFPRDLRPEQKSQLRAILAEPKTGIPGINL